MRTDPSHVPVHPTQTSCIIYWALPPCIREAAVEAQRVARTITALEYTVSNLQAQSWQTQRYQKREWKFRKESFIHLIFGRLVAVLALDDCVDIALVWLLMTFHGLRFRWD